MAITTVNPRYEGFIFDGENSRDYGIYVQDVKVFGAPTRDVEMVSIPGRDGEFVLDKGRFNNIQVVYTCALGTDTQTDFNTGVSDFRNWLASRKGYKRLEDEINTTEYRMAVFKDGLDVSTLNKETGTFEVTFDCKPQRFLKSGEIPRTIGGSVTNSQTKSGAVVSIDSDGGDKATSLIANIEAIQTGSGDPSPTNVRPITGWTAANVYVTGKNLLPKNAAGTTTRNGITSVLNDDGSAVLNGTASAQTDFNFFNAPTVTQGFKGSYIINGIEGGSGSTYSMGVRIRNTSTNTNRFVYVYNGDKAVATNDDEVINRVFVTVYNNATVDNVILRPMLRLASETDDTYETSHGAIHPISFGSAGTVYDGTVDVVTGVLTVTWAGIDMGTMNWSYTDSLSCFTSYITGKESGNFNLTADCYATTTSTSVGGMGDFQIKGRNGYTTIYVKDSRYTDGTELKTALSGHNLVYELETPTTVQLTAQQVELLAGQNNVWADTGDISITYGHDPNKLVNPTLFESHPTLEVNGYGSISIGGGEITLHNDPIGRVQLGGGTSYKNTITYTFDQTQFNTGDFITVPDYRRTFQIDMVKPYGSGEIIDFQVTSMTAPDYIFSATKYQGALTLLTDASIFSVGTARTDSYNVVGKISYKNSSGTASEADFRAGASVAYDGNGSVTFTAFKFATDASFVYTTVAGNAPNFYGDSTWQPVTDTAYIDLDIGEAYVINDGAVIGINNIVDLPAELPTLKAGANTLTYDNTVTELVILPRWWKV